MNLSDGAASDRVQGHVVTQNYFSVVGVDVARGRVFGPADEDVVVVSHGLWQRMLGGREDVLGRRLTINGKPSVVIGVAPPGFTGLLRGLPADLWLPLERQSQLAEQLTERGSRWLTVVGRLADGVELPRAQAAFKVIGDQLHRAYPQEWTDLKGEGRRITLEPANQSLLVDRADVLPFMATLMAVVGIVLLLACVNVSNLMLARAAVRSREMAIRLSVGAGRARVLRQLFTESVLLAIAGRPGQHARCVCRNDAVGPNAAAPAAANLARLESRCAGAGVHRPHVPADRHAVRTAARPPDDATEPDHGAEGRRSRTPASIACVVAPSATDWWPCRWR